MNFTQHNDYDCRCAKLMCHHSLTLQELLNGQKLQGVLTSNEVQEILRSKGWEQRFPLFTTINRIIQGYLSPDWVCR